MELNELQIKVANEFSIIKASKTFSESDYQKIRKVGGCLMIPVFPIVEFLGARFIAKEKSQRNHDIYEAEAVELLKNPTLRKEICSALILITKNKILSEEDFINYITAILFENKIRSKFVIPLEPALFAYIAYKISDNGINDFCAAQIN